VDLREDKDGGLQQPKLPVMGERIFSSCAVAGLLAAGFGGWLHLSWIGIIIAFVIFGLMTYFTQGEAGAA
jgi:hypothetical protein